MQVPDKHSDKESFLVARLLPFGFHIDAHSCCHFLRLGRSQTVALLLFARQFSLAETWESQISCAYATNKLRSEQKKIKKNETNISCLHSSSVGNSNRIAVSVLQFVESIITWYYYSADGFKETLQPNENTIHPKWKLHERVFRYWLWQRNERKKKNNKKSMKIYHSVECVIVWEIPSFDYIFN